MKRLEDMTLEELWELFPIVLTDCNPEWPLWAADEIATLRKLLSHQDVRFHHVGSTAVGGIRSKPIIDIIVEVDSQSGFDKARAALSSDGYIRMSSSESRVSFNKGYTPEGYAERVFHIHLRITGDTDEVFFRDYLRAHQDISKAYEALKIKLAERFPHDRDAYTRAKTPFVIRYTALAKKNQAGRGESPTGC